MSALLQRHAGLVVPPVLWAASVELGLALPPTECGGSGGGFWLLAASLSALFLALAASIVSARFAGRTEGRMPRFIGRLSCIVGLAVAFAMALQGAAAWLLDPCLR